MGSLRSLSHHIKPIATYEVFKTRWGPWACLRWTDIPRGEMDDAEDQARRSRSGSESSYCNDLPPKEEQKDILHVCMWRKGRWRVFYSTEGPDGKS